MPTTYLKFHVTSAHALFPISNCFIRIYRKEQQVLVFEDYARTDANGLTTWLALYVEEKDVLYYADCTLQENRRLTIKLPLQAKKQFLCCIDEKQDTFKQALVPTRYADCIYHFQYPFIQPFTIKENTIYFSSYLNHLCDKTSKQQETNDKDCTIQLLDLQDCYHQQELFNTHHQSSLSHLTKQDLLHIQQQLNLISLLYPSIPYILHEDGIWNNESKQAIKQFHHLFHLKQGTTLTPASIQRIYEVSAYFFYTSLSSTLKNYPLKCSNRHIDIMYYKILINQLTTLYPSIPRCPISDTFDDSLKHSILTLQKLFGCKQTGQLDEPLKQILHSCTNDIKQKKELS